MLAFSIAQQGLLLCPLPCRVASSSTSSCCSLVVGSLLSRSPAAGLHTKRVPSVVQRTLGACSRAVPGRNTFSADTSCKSLTTANHGRGRTAARRSQANDYLSSSHASFTRVGDFCSSECSTWLRRDGPISQRCLSGTVASGGRQAVVAAPEIQDDEQATDTSCEGVEGLPNVIDILKERGLADAITSEELRKAASKPLKVYCGFDPTAESLHLGNLLGIIVLAWFQRCGHTPVALLGGATARVGDPSGKSAERPMMDEATIERNLAGIRRVLTSILRADRDDNNVDGGGGTARASAGASAAASGASSAASASSAGSATSSASAAGDGTSASAEGDGGVGGGAGGGSGVVRGRRREEVVVNNYDWWKDVSLLAFLRDVGKYARVGTMMAKESVRKRLASDDGMSYTEFTYQLLQGYDFVHLYREQGVQVQLGGSDQWGNITAGTDLVRRLLQKDAYGLTWPLLLKSDGSKFGKSEGGAIWLSAAMLSPYKFYQYLFATPDADVIKFMKLLTFMDLAEVADYEAQMARPGYVPNVAQQRLAQEVTRFVHGEKGVQEALKATQALAPGAATKLDLAALEAIAETVDCKDLPLSEVVGSNIVELSVKAGLFPSKGAARRTLKQGGVYLNNAKVESEEQVLVEEDVIGGKMLMIGAGKKNKLLLRIS